MNRSQLMEEIASIWKPHQARTRWREDGFDWSPGSHLVRLRAFPPRTKDPGQSERWGLTVETELLRSPPIDAASFTDGLAGLAHIATSMYSLAYPPQAIWKRYFDNKPPVLRLFSSVYVSSKMLDTLPQLLCQVALLQAASAELQSEQLAEFVGGQPAFIGSGKTLDYDKVIDAAQDFYLREGAKPSRWTNVSEFAEFAEQHGESDTCFGYSDESGMTLETPFGDGSALIRFQSNVPHPQLGNGLRVTVGLPFIPGEETPVMEAAWLNYLEAMSWTDVPQLGCWHVHTDGASVAHSCFVPNALYIEGLAGNLAWWSIDRARWVRRTRWPKLEDKPMSQIIEERLTNGVYH